MTDLLLLDGEKEQNGETPQPGEYGPARFY